LIASTNRPIVWSYCRTLYSFPSSIFNGISISCTAEGNTFSTSCAITPTFGNDCCNSSAFEFQSHVTPFNDCTFSIGLEISSILSFNLSSEEAYATTSPPTFNAPPIPTPPATTRAPTSVAFVAVVFLIVITPLAESSAFERRKLLEVKPSSYQRLD